MVLFNSCKKEQDPSELIGLWEVELLTISTYDSLDNIISVDTSMYVDNIGNPVTLLEKYTADNNYFAFSDTISDTVKTSTYTLNDNNLLLNIPDSVWSFNNRTITTLNDINLELFQIIITSSVKQKWVQRYRRR